MRDASSGAGVVASVESGAAAGAILVVLGETGVNAAGALAAPGPFAARYYAPAPKADGTADASALPPGVVRLRATAGAAAIDEARATGPGRPLVAINAGERLVTTDLFDAHEGGGRDADRVEKLPVEIRVAGGNVRGMPWFHDRYATLVVASTDSWRREALLVTRDPGDLAAILRTVRNEALSATPRDHAIGTASLLVLPVARALRVYLACGWRWGIRGFLMSMLHGLCLLMTLARDRFETARPEEGDR